MKSTIIHVGLDVDDTQYHGSALNRDSGEVVDFQCRPTLKGLVSQLGKLSKHCPGCSIKICYEASYVGYSLQRDLTEQGYHCDVVAPTQIPTPRGKAVKTDRIDAKQLAPYYANDLLTIVQPPEAVQEQDRDLLRSRQNLMDRRTELRRHIQSLLRRYGWHYKAQTRNKTHWTQRHHLWLEHTIEGLSGSLKANLKLLLRQLQGLDEILAEYGREVAALVRMPRYAKSAQALMC